MAKTTRRRLTDAERADACKSPSRHYDTDTGTRLLVGQRIDGTVHVFDEPTSTGPTLRSKPG